MNCIRCKRAIDQTALLCPFCNWDQSKTPPTHEFVPEQVANYKPPEQTSMRKRALFAGGGVLVLVASFFIGLVINKDDAPKVAPQTLEEQAAERIAAGTPRRADTVLIATNERGGFEAPITSAPAVTASGTTSDYERNDATAVSSIEYTEMAKRAKAEKERVAAAVDPRSITGSPYVAPPERSLPPPQTSASTFSDSSPARRTRPVLEYRPLPPMNARGSARLTLMIGSDGHVSQVDIDRPLQGNNAQLLAAVQRWRFKPATENGEPIAAPYSVEISFNR